MRRIFVFLFLLTGLVGCGGQYTLTVPDQVAPAGGDALAVIRLQRNDFFVLDLAVKDACMALRIADGPERGAYTDNLGYAAAPVPVPDKPGVYTIRVSHLDIEGDEVVKTAPVFVWKASYPVVAVDTAALPTGGKSRESAVAAIKKLGESTNILYLSAEPADDHKALHKRLLKAGYPDGPILSWQRERWHIVREDWKMPRIVVETRMISQLGTLRKNFPNLVAGVGRSAVAAKAFNEAKMKCIVIGSGNVPVKSVRRTSWADLAKEGL